HLIQMRPAVHAFQQYRIHFRAQRLDRVDELDAPLVLELGGEPIDAVAAVLDVGTAAFEGGDDPRARQVVGIALVVEQLGERRHVRAVGADDADPELRGLLGGRARRPQQRKRRNDQRDERALLHGAAIFAHYGRSNATRPPTTVKSARMLRSCSGDTVRKGSLSTTKSPTLPFSIDPRFFSSKLNRAAMLVIIRSASCRETASVSPITRPLSVRRVVAEYIVRNGLNGFSASSRSRPNMWSVLIATSTPASRHVRSPMKWARRSRPRPSASASASL